MTGHRAEVYRSLDGWRYRLLAMNGEIIDHSEAYTRRWSAVRAARANTDATEIRVLTRAGDLFRTITR